MSDYDILMHRIRQAERRSRYIRVKEIGKVRYKSKLYKIIRIRVSKPGKRRYKACFSAGVHGNEDFAIESFLEFLAFLTGSTGDAYGLRQAEISRVLDDFQLIAYLFNPIGYDRKIRTNGRRQDLNRWFGKAGAPAEVRAVTKDIGSRRFDLFIDLHGDRFQNMFYLYERTRLAVSLARKIIQAEKRHRISVQASYRYGREKISYGIINDPKYLHTFDDYMFYEKQVPVCLVLEYGGRIEDESDIKAMLIAQVQALIGYVKLKN